MKRKSLILLSVILVLCLLAASCDATPKEEEETKLKELDMSKFVFKTTDMYENANKVIIKNLTLYFTDKDSQIPYIDANFIETIYGDLFAIGVSDNKVVLTNKVTKATMTIDTENKNFVFSDYCLFFKRKEMATCNDILSSFSERFIKRKAGIDIFGGPLVVNYGSFDINVYTGLIYDNDGNAQPEFLMPLRTFCDIDKNYLSQLTYNGKDLFFASYDNFVTQTREKKLTDLGKQYFDNGINSRNEELIDFNYKELLLNLSLNYGLQERKGIVNFDDSLSAWGIKDKLYSTDSNVSSQAICEFIYTFIGDLHSSYGCMTPYSEKFTVQKPSDYSVSERELNSWYLEMNAERKKAFGSEAFPGFEIIESTYTDYKGEEKCGNTAFVTFDNFTAKKIDYTVDETRQNLMANTKIETDFANSGADTIGLVVYANAKIKEWDKNHPEAPVKNVVVDLSCNTGGAADAAFFVSGWLIGKTPISIESANTGSKSTTYYYADVNMDKIYQTETSSTDYSDNVLDKNVFLITSRVSFSCGNLLPYLVKTSRRGVLLGSWTGGGACCVLSTATADGTLFKMSGMNRLCYESNGSFVDLDNGIDVDYKFSKPDQYYDRESIVNKINNNYLIKSISD